MKQKQKSSYLKRLVGQRGVVATVLGPVLKWKKNPCTSFRILKKTYLFFKFKDVLSINLHLIILRFKINNNQKFSQKY